MFMRTRRGWFIASLLFVAMAPDLAYADDGCMLEGGAPQLMGEHPTVSMVNEIVHISIEHGDTLVDCRFLFHNEGPACTVRMGFPDRAEGADVGNPNWGHQPPQGNFLYFASYVDGQAVPTEIIDGEDKDEYWHIKSVRFGKGQSRMVRDVYTMMMGGMSDGIGSTTYILSTGGSWHRPIERAEIDVTIKNFPLPLAVRPGPNRENHEQGFGDNIPAGSPPATVIYRGSCAPTVDGNTLKFVRTNFRPTDEDDVTVSLRPKDLETDFPTGDEQDRWRKLPYIGVYPIQHRLTEADLHGVSTEDRRVILNAIFARHGRQFLDFHLAWAFEIQDWYKKSRSWKPGDEDALLTPLDWENVRFLQECKTG